MRPGFDPATRRRADLLVEPVGRKVSAAGPADGAGLGVSIGFGKPRGCDSASGDVCGDDTGSEDVVHDAGRCACALPPR
jgi:hypothetical protein